MGPADSFLEESRIMKYRNVARRVGRALNSRFAYLMRFPTYSGRIKRLIWSSGDPVRYASIALALETIEQEKIFGSVAEVGVYRGEMSRFIHAVVPERRLYLFDTFKGFPASDLDVAGDERFSDTDARSVAATFGNDANIVIRKGYFPNTTQGLEREMFSFILLDLDLYKPTMAGLDFFYPRLTPGGFLVLHDYNSPESDHAISRAVHEFLADKPERVMEIPDRWGSAWFRKFHHVESDGGRAVEVGRTS